LQKVIYYPLQCVLKSKQTFFTKVISGLLLLILNCWYRINFQIWVKHGCKSLHVQNWAPHANLPAESANCMQQRSCFAIPLEELKFKFANGGKIKTSFKHPRSLYSTRPIQPNHFHADLIWCDSTFKKIRKNSHRIRNQLKSRVGFGSEKNHSGSTTQKKVIKDAYLRTKTF
jgi:hypothetical protein